MDNNDQERERGITILAKVGLNSFNMKYASLTDVQPMPWWPAFCVVQQKWAVYCQRGQLGSAGSYLGRYQLLGRRKYVVICAGLRLVEPIVASVDSVLKGHGPTWEWPAQLV